MWMRRAIASFELCCSLAQLLKPTSIYVFISIFTYTRSRYLYSGGSILAILAILTTRVMRNVTKSITITSIEIRHCIYTTITISAYLCIYYCLTILYTPSKSRFAICGDTRNSRRETRKKITEISLPSLFSFFFLFTFACALCFVSLPE